MLCNQAENVKENYTKTDLIFPPDFENAEQPTVVYGFYIHNN